MRIRTGEFDPIGTVQYNQLGWGDTDTVPGHVTRNSNAAQLMQNTLSVDLGSRGWQVAHRDSALRAAREAIVLLNNSISLLPLQPKTVHRFEKDPQIQWIQTITFGCLLPPDPKAGLGQEDGRTVRSPSLLLPGEQGATVLPATMCCIVF